MSQVSLARLVLLGFCAVSAGAVSAPALALECPAPQASGPGVIQESAANIASVSALLAAGDLGNRLPDIVAGLRQRHPGVPGASIVNYLMAAYCPIVARDPALDEAGRQARMDAFAGQVVPLAMN